MSQATAKPIYVLAGDDALLRDQHRQRVLREIVGDADPQSCVRTFDSPAEPAEVLDELRTRPFLAPAKAVILREADDFVSAHADKLLRYLESPAACSSLILQVNRWEGDTGLAKAVAKAGEVIYCGVADTDIQTFLRDSARRRGKSLEPEAAMLLAQFVGTDLARLDSEVEKLTLLVGQRRQIEPADVAEVVADIAGPGSFELSNALMASDAKAAMRALSRSLSIGEPYALLPSIAWHLRRILTASQQIARGVPLSQALPRMPYPQRQAMTRLLSARPLSRVQADVRAVLAADLAIKSGADAPGVLTRLVAVLCMP